MCMIDWRLGRYLRSRVLGDIGTGLSSIPPNNQRVALLVSVAAAPSGPPFGNAVLLNPAGVPVIIIHEDNSPVVLSIMEYGDLITKGFAGTGISITASAVVTELTLPEEFLSAAIESFKSEYKPWLK